MSSNQFLNATEINEIAADYQEYFGGEESSDITLKFYRQPAPTINAAFNAVTSNPTIVTVAVKGQQEIITEGKQSVRAQELLSIGALEEGDCIFHFPNTVNLSLNNSYETLEIIDHNNVTWIPLPTESKEQQASYTFLQSQIGNVQLAQAVPATLKPNR